MADAQHVVKFCDLLRNPQKYAGEQVKVRASWEYGFEWTYLFCFDCEDSGRAWLDFSDDLDRSSEKVLKHKPKGAALVNITLVGTLVGPGTYGHMGGYRYKFTATKAETIRVILKGMHSPEEEKAAAKRKPCDCAAPE